LKVKTQNPLFLRNGEYAAQLSFWFSHVPWTRITGGLAAVPLQLKSLAPGGGVCGSRTLPKNPFIQFQSTGSGVAAEAGVVGAASIRPSADRAVVAATVRRRRMGTSIGQGRAAVR
jgi:hypothetical protein